MAVERINYIEISSSCSSLTSVATNLSETISRIETAISEITDPTWDGEASRNYVEKLKSFCNNLPDANRQLAEAILFLASCADGYKSIDQASVKALKDIIGEDYINSYDVSKAPEVDLSSRLTETTLKSRNNQDNQNTFSSQENTASIGGYTGTSVALGGGVAYISLPKEKSITDNSEENNKKNETVTIVPDKINQKGMAINEYDKIHFKEDSDAYKLKTLWKEQGENYVNGIATIKVNGKDRYLVETSAKYGKVGDIIDVKLNNNDTIECIISNNNSSKTYFGQVNDKKETTVLTFEVDSKKIQEYGVFDTKKWNLSWDINSPVKEIKNEGKNILIKNKSITGNKYTKNDTPRVSSV